MNRPPQSQQPRPMRDHVRVTPGTRNAAAALPSEKEFDDAKLMNMLQSANKELQGLRLMHLHIGLLETTELSDSVVSSSPICRCMRRKPCSSLFADCSMFMSLASSNSFSLGSAAAALRVPGVTRTWS